ncbi:hypothetical protein CISG_06242 [Coccidioides immitis RMSCC 3703]|uniref:Uncharacterized protein n=1 Tax=Coccidioides immitis RMSCC 3703 TaxID=454286 RepID=A0A0J8TT84_COCIT|nr:hypothetical protein CISG_06242 [Coccidioides immitis RMSCC 3703]
MVNTWMAVFLRVHCDAVEATRSQGDSSEDDMNIDSGIASGAMTLQTAMVEWKAEQEREGRRLAD